MFVCVDLMCVDVFDCFEVCFDVCVVLFEVIYFFCVIICDDVFVE